MTRVTHILVDVEADGPCPGLYSMTELGAVAIMPDDSFETFHTFLKPITSKFDVSAMLNKTRVELLGYPAASEGMVDFYRWVLKYPKPFFVSDNNGFDWQFVNYYFHYFIGRNPFGHSSTNLGSLYKGMKGTMFGDFKHLRKTPHTHNPVDDAMGNAEAFLAMKGMGLKTG